LHFSRIFVILVYHTAENEGMEMNAEIRLGDVITTRKPHPCGGNEWTVIRTGADIKIKCARCGRIVMLDRESFLRRRKTVIKQGETPAMIENGEEEK